MSITKDAESWAAWDAEHGKGKFRGAHFSSMSRDEFHSYIKENFDKTMSLREVQTAIKNTVGAEITEDGLKLTVARFQPEDQAGGRAVRTGVFYLPEENSPYQKYYNKPGGNVIGYGGNEKFVGETVYRNPLVVQGATGGNVPKQAYDAIEGRGSYGIMASDAPSGNPGESREQTITRMESFLEEYGGDKNFAYDIVDTAKPGTNNMRMAAIEHVVACTARDSGYDSIIGYTTYKGQEHFSEVFDLREEEYPWQNEWQNDYSEYFDEFYDNAQEKSK